MSLRSAILTAFATLLAAAPAAAQPLIEDFESGALVGPSGKWNGLVVDAACSPCSLTAEASAARRGNFGLSFNDGANTAAAGRQGEIFAAIAEVPAVYGRFWFRATTSNGRGAIILTQVIDDFSGNPMLDLSLDLNSGTFKMGGFDDNGAYQLQAAPFALPLNTWYLFEYQITGVGTENGSLKGFIDGTLRAQVNMDLDTLDTARITLGEPWSDDRTFQGRLTYDDFRVDTAPLASRWALSISSEPAIPGICLAVTVSLHNSINGAPAPAPYPVEGALASSGAAGGFFSDPGCATPTTAVTLTTGAQTGTVYYRPTAAGTTSLSVSHLDFLEANVLLQAATEAGGGNPATGGGASNGSCPTSNPLCKGEPLQVGSSCGAAGSSGAGGLSLLVALFAFWCARGRSRHS